MAKAKSVPLHFAGLKILPVKIKENGSAAAAVNCCNVWLMTYQSFLLKSSCGSSLPPSSQDGTEGLSILWVPIDHCSYWWVKCFPEIDLCFHWHSNKRFYLFSGFLLFSWAIPGKGISKYRFPSPRADNDFPFSKVRRKIRRAELER